MELFFFIECGNRITKTIILNFIKKGVNNWLNIQGRLHSLTNKEILFITTKDYYLIECNQEADKFSLMGKITAQDENLHDDLSDYFANMKNVGINFDSMINVRKQYDIEFKIFSDPILMAELVENVRIY